MAKARYNVMDEILGDKNKRFFSNGYKNISHDLKAIRIVPDEKLSKAVGSVTYPDNWSAKKSNNQLKPHLSTVDVFIFSVLLNTIYLKEIYGLHEEQIRRLWIRSVMIKAGAEAVYGLNRIEMTSLLVETVSCQDSICGNISRFSNNIGGLKVEVAFDHSIETVNQNEKFFDGVGDVSGQIEKGYCGSMYKQCSHNIGDIDIDLDTGSISSLITIDGQEPCEGLDGISSRYYPFYNMMDTFVCASQQMQSLIYQLDGINRECSNNLWMRKITYEYRRPIFESQGYRQSASIKNTKIIYISGMKWRMAEIDCRIDSSSNPFFLRVSLAHQLPE